MKLAFTFVTPPLSCPRLSRVKFRLLLFTAGLLACVSSASGALELTTLLSFDDTNGALPCGALVEGRDHNFYGTTTLDGRFHGEFCQGTVFKISPQGRLVTLVGFTGTNGSEPRSPLLLASDGSLFGTTVGGGVNGDYGTVFKLDPRGGFTSLFSFDGTNGSNPNCIIEGKDGFLYGTTESFASWGGTVFRMTPTGELTTLFVFNVTNGSDPQNLLQGEDGCLYGTTSGTVFRLTPTLGFTTLYAFDGTNGGMPTSLIQSKDGNLYGTTGLGGANNNGTVFRLTTNGVLTILHSFSRLENNGQNADGANPVGRLMQAADGCLYGGTLFGGEAALASSGRGGVGTLFRITINGTLTTLCSFGNFPKYYVTGAFPTGLVEAQPGRFYGATFVGGVYDQGNRGLGSFFRVSRIRPVIRITAPVRSVTRRSETTIQGRTRGRAAIAKVCYQLNNAAWVEATTTNSWANWAALVNLRPGVNSFRTYALDVTGCRRRSRP